MKNFKLPDTLVISLLILLLVIFLTWVVPAGEFARKVYEGRNIVVPGSYQPVAQSPQSLLTFFTAPVKGFEAAAEVISFIFVVGGAFGMLSATGAIEAGLKKLVDISVANPVYKWVILPLLMVVFSLAAGSFGLSEENLVFVLITIPLARSLGYDSITGVAIPLVASGAGFSGAFSNPFTVGVAQQIAELQVFSGIEYRLFAWFVLTAVAISYIMFYIFRLEKDKTISVMYGLDQDLSEEHEDPSLSRLTSARQIILVLFVITLILLIWGVTQKGWFITEIAGLFFGFGILASFVGKLNLQEMTDAFVEGAKTMMTACLIVGFCRGILIVATDGKIIDTFLFWISLVLDDMPGWISIQVMFLFQAVLNFFVPSGSGQAALTMPLMAPLSDLLGIGRQTAVLAFQFGDGLTNLIIPTSGVTMGILSIAKIPYQKWVQWILPLMVLLFGTAMLLLLGPTLFFKWE